MKYTIDGRKNYTVADSMSEVYNLMMELNSINDASLVEEILFIDQMGGKFEEDIKTILDNFNEKLSELDRKTLENLYLLTYAELVLIE